MEVERGAEAGNFLHEFLSRFSASCRDDAESQRQQQQQHQQPHQQHQATGAPPAQAGILLVRIAGEVLLYCSAHLAQVSFPYRLCTYGTMMRC